MNKKLYNFIFLALAVCIVAIIGWTNRYTIYDKIKLFNYDPSLQVSELAEQSGMGQYGKVLFYINDPKISDQRTFRKECKQAEQTIVLGCYNGQNIYIYKVTDAQLNGVEQVTAAHEMLHAAYARLSSKDKKQVDEMIKSAYKRLNDPKLISTYESYHKSEPGQEWNEMHSVLGTEYSNLGADLENYYKKYFIDRSKVVTLANKYQKVFDDLKDEVEQYDAQLSLLKIDIEQKQNNLSNKLQDIDIQKTQLNAMQASGSSSYDSAANLYNSNVYSYNQSLKELQNLINQYNLIVENRNKIAVEQQGLTKSIDSRILQEPKEQN